MPAENDLSVSTQQALQDNIETLTVAAPKRRGRPPKVRPIVVIEDDEIVCPKCKKDDPGDWSQCQGCCPMPESPCYNEDWLKKYNENNFGNWKTFNVSETSAIFLKWFQECEKLLEPGWTLKIGAGKKFIRLYISKESQKRPFAFVRKNTGNIHTPMTARHAFNHFVGNISDPETRLSVMTPLGVKAHWSFLPTHENYNETLAKSIMIEYDTTNTEDDDDGE